MSDGCVLVVEDDVLIALDLVEYLEEFGQRVCGTAASVDQAIALADEHRPKLVLMDVRLKGQRDGVDAATEIYNRYRTPVIFITGSREPQTVRRIQEDHPAAVLFKPIYSHELKRVLEEILARG